MNHTHYKCAYPIGAGGRENLIAETYNAQNLADITVVMTTRSCRGCYSMYSAFCLARILTDRYLGDHLHPDSFVSD